MSVSSKRAGLVAAICLAVVSLPVWGEQVNLLANGGFELDSDGDDVPDGWLGQPHNFSRETPEQAQLPLPEGLALGAVTCVVSNLLPHEQVVSELIAVKPNTGYRLSYWFRMDGAQTVMFQIMDADAPRNEAWPSGGTEARRQVISGKSLGWANVAHWRRYEIPFRTGPEETAIRLRPWVYFQDPTDDRRLWYDDFQLVEDGSVVVGDLADPVNLEPDWPKEAIERGYAVVPRPSLPPTCHTYMPRLAELNEPLRLTVAAGETGSAAVFVRSLGEELKLRAAPGPLRSENGYGIANGYGARSIYLRAAEDLETQLDFQRFMIRPEFLKFSNELAIKANDGGQFWLTVEVPPGTPPGDYTGDVTITPVGGGEETKLPVVLTVRDMKLLESDVAFGTWYQTDPLSGVAGPSYVLPGSDDIFLADQRRHGMNTVGAYCMAERKDKDGGYHLSLNELDAMVAGVKRAGLCARHPLLLLTWSDLGVGGGFGCLGGEGQAVMDLYEHAQDSGWPQLLLYVLDEPGGGERAKMVEEVMKYYTPARRKGVRTVTAGPNPQTQGKYYDVWIESMYVSNWDELHALAAEHGSELWMYDCGLTGRNPLVERFYAGLWTWRTGVKGNMVWSYGWYVRINDQGLPESKLAWEGRLAGVNDYRYLHTIERAVAAAETAGRGRDPAVRAARIFLRRLRARIPLDVYDWQSRPQGSDIAHWNPLPKMQPEEYDRMREECAGHIQAIRSSLPATAVPPRVGD